MHQIFNRALLSLGWVAFGLNAAPSTEQVEFFEKKIRPVLAEHCYECHNSSGKEKGGLALDWAGGLAVGGDSGSLLGKDDPAKSMLLQVIRHEDLDMKMPKGGPKLSPEVIADFEKWVIDGAPDPRASKPSKEEIAKATSWETIRERRKQWWSFQPIRQAFPPKVDGDWARSDIDRFIQAGWKDAGLAPSDDAGAEALIRRLSFSIIGLPPTSEETKVFVKAASENRQGAVEAAVARLLSSPHFGERWARHWMDWVRYAESLGSEGDPSIPFANRYRNYLIRALNADVSYDHLLREHIAGDLLEQPRLNQDLGLNESAIGPAHYRFVLQGFAPTDALDELVRTTENQIDVVSKAFLGLTVACARCHNHKFDAISQEDYHAFYSIMTSSRPATIDVNTPERRDKNKTALANLKPQIRQVLADQWLKEAGKIAAKLTEPSGRWKELIEGAKENKNPLHAWRKLRLAKGEEFGKTWRQLAGEFAQSQKALNEQNARGYAKRWQIDRNATSLGSWVLDGNGLDGSVAKPGAFRVLPSGDSVVDAILPGGVYSHLLSDKHTGVLSSPAFKAGEGQRLYVRVVANGDVMTRYVVQNYTRGGTVYPTTRLREGKWRWQSWDIGYWSGDDLHLEVTTAGEQAILFSNKADSWFGVTDVLVASKDEPAPKEEMAEYVQPVFAKDEPANAKLLAKRYAVAVRQSIRDWRNGKMSNEQAHFLNYFVREGLLNNSSDVSPEVAKLVAEYRKLEAEIPLPQRAPGVLEAEAFDRPLFLRGNHKQPAQAVPRRFLEAFDAKPFDAKNSGRVELAEAMLHEDNPLTARVIVNRIWHHLIGRGLVATPDNFGKLGEKPTHPELLDYLAKRFVSEGWSIKKLVREITLTRTFQLAVTSSVEVEDKDPDNRLLARANVRRLEAEAIRDAMLQVSGSLDRSPLGGSDNTDSNRRSLYQRVIRNRLNPFLTVMDAPVPTSTTGRRDVTNVPAQSLTMMNDPFILSLAERFANRVKGDESLKTVEAQVDAMFRMALNRAATPNEFNGAKAFLGDADAKAVRVKAALMNTNEEVKNIEAQLKSLREPLLKQLVAKRKESELSTVAGPKPFAAWDFSQGTKDQLGQAHLSLEGGAKVEDGALVLDGKRRFARSQPLSKQFRDKTLEAWVQLSDLAQKGGGVITVQTQDGVNFDSIVYAEKQGRRWLAGSENHVRTDDFNGPKEKEALEGPVHVAIVYHADGKITGYRNGKPYGRAFRKDALREYKGADTEVVFGMRHGKGASGDRMLAGRVFKARLYDRALSADAVMASFFGNTSFVSEEQLLAEMTEAQRDSQAKWQVRLAEVKKSKSELEKASKSVQDPWRDLAQAMFNLKEFIYLR
jgi:mono/diheme cytochrome c family protein